MSKVICIKHRDYDPSKKAADLNCKTCTDAYVHFLRNMSEETRQRRHEESMRKMRLYSEEMRDATKELTDLANKGEPVKVLTYRPTGPNRVMEAVDRLDMMLKSLKDQTILK